MENKRKNFQHKELAAGRWAQFSFVEQMANVGSEVERAFERALELVDLTIMFNRIPSHFKELTRMREALVDYFFGQNEFESTAAAWRSYFLPFMYAARRNR